MVFNKNSNLILDVCLVQIKSIDTTVDIPALTTIYHTPSKINLTVNSKPSPAGVLIKKNLSLLYPGLSITDFDDFNDLCRGAYQIYVKTTTNDIYEIASNQFFMSCDTSFNIKTGHSLNFKSSHPIPIKHRGNQPDDGINIDGFDYDLDFYLK